MNARVTTRHLAAPGIQEAVRLVMARVRAALDPAPVRLPGAERLRLAPVVPNAARGLRWFGRSY